MATLTAAGVNFSDGSTINGTVKNSVGYYIIAGWAAPSGSYQPNTTTAGSNLRLGPIYSNIVNASTSAGLSGTYRSCGFFTANYDSCGGNQYAGQTLWVRIS